ncbi:hypothetical protein CUJ91_04770 [Paraburkholderia graminis]|uniref:hypothetical protein n=1 Tax=Paraburkholderia graminis TaxID=60548 RepID=UPI000DEF8204|nr:hypothetical protein [Paraburkholderia graminis]AXF07310.1 hypothetical protein CUJ91_04770 [Paraburkholderia graminis]
MNKLLKRLLGLLFPGVGDDDGAASDDAGDTGALIDESADDSGLADLEFDLVEDTPAASARGNEADRLARLEAEVERRGRLRDEEMRRVSQTAPPVDPEFQREEERLRAADTSEMERWQIQANRALRQTQLEAQRARMEASDLMDRTRFESKFNSDPRRAKYADRVEEAIAQERAQGRSASRESVYYYMLGKDIADGKLKPKAKAKVPAAEVPRGRAPNARSDVSSRRGNTEQDKRRARLENMNI